MLSALRHHRDFDGTFEGAATAGTWLHEIATAERLPEALIFGIEVCLEELFTNVVRHGGDGRSTDGEAAPLKVNVAIELDDDDVRLVIGDNAQSFDVSRAEGQPVHQRLEDVAPGGLGIQLIRSFSNDVRYEPLPNGNRVIVKFLRQARTGAKAEA